MKREEAQKQAGQVSRAIRQCNNKQSVLKVTAVNSDGIEVKLHSQETMVPVMAASNLVRQQECIGAPSMEPLFDEEFGYLAETDAALEVINGTYVPPPLAWS